MQKQEFIAKVAEAANVSKANAESVTNAVIATLTDVLANGDKIQFVGFGTFETKARAARAGKNPMTGEAITIPAATVPSFKAGSKLKEAVNK